LYISYRHKDNFKLKVEWQINKSGLVEIFRETSEKSKFLNCVCYADNGNFVRYFRCNRNYEIFGVDRTYNGTKLESEKNYLNGKLNFFILW
jgi:hypothetical protein